MFILCSHTVSLLWGVDMFILTTNTLSLMIDRAICRVWLSPPEFWVMPQCHSLTLSPRPRFERWIRVWKPHFINYSFLKSLHVSPEDNSFESQGSPLLELDLTVMHLRIRGNIQPPRSRDQGPVTEVRYLGIYCVEMPLWRWSRISPTIFSSSPSLDQ